jgi:DNA-binding transcriptional LysR family regulator
MSVASPADRLPLTALQAFETAARTGGFATAGAVLGVSGTAVGQQVRTLEQRLGKVLFQRRPNGVELTDAGRTLYLRLTAAFAELHEAAAEVRALPARPRVVLSVLPSLGPLWLLPVLAAAGIDLGGLRIVQERDDPVELGPRGADVRLTYGGGAYPALPVEELFRDRMLPVAAPGHAGDAPGEALAEARLIHTSWGPDYASPQSWATWFAATGRGPAPDPARGIVIDRLDNAAMAARCGIGTALLPERLAAADLARGSLVAVGSGAAPLPQPYVLVARPAARPRASVAAVLRALRQGAVVARITES